MASKRIISSLVARAGVPRISARCLHIQSATAARSSRISAPQSASIPTSIQRRYESSSAGTESKIYTFEEIQQLSQSPSSSSAHLLIDTREPSELRDTGRIPGSINIPIASNPDAFFLSEEDFEDRFGVARPAADRELVMYCKAGVRSRAAAKLAGQGGWKRVAEYPGSWLEWYEKGGEVERG